MTCNIKGMGSSSVCMQQKAGVHEAYVVKKSVLNQKKEVIAAVPENNCTNLSHVMFE